MLIACSTIISDRKKFDQVKEMISNAGRTRTILSRCDNADAVHVGQSLGISMFQGRHLDFLLQDLSRKAPATAHHGTRSA